jgi:hypothetical protein
MSGVFFLIRVRLACLCCFATLSQFLRQLTLRQQGTLLWNNALGRIGRPEEMASAILFLVLDASSYCTALDWWWRMAASRRFEFGTIGAVLRNLREVRAMQQQTAYSSWIIVPVG